jgi:hypothetical protein
MLEATSIPAIDVLFLNGMPSGLNSAPYSIDVQPRIGRSDEDKTDVIAQVASTPHQLDWLATGERCFDREIESALKRRGNSLQRNAAGGKGASRSRSTPNRQCDFVRIDAITHNDRRQQVDERCLTRSVCAGYNQKARLR